MSLHFGKVSEKLNGGIQSYKQRSVIFGNFGPFCPIFDPFLVPPGAHLDFLSKIGECHFLTWVKIQLHAKFQKISMDGCREKSGRTNGRTDMPQNNSPPPIGRGTKNALLSGVSGQK